MHFWRVATDPKKSVKTYKSSVGSLPIGFSISRGSLTNDWRCMVDDFPREKTLHRRWSKTLLHFPLWEPGYEECIFTRDISTLTSFHRNEAMTFLSSEFTGVCVFLFGHMTYAINDSWEASNSFLSEVENIVMNRLLIPLKWEDGYCCHIHILPLRMEIACKFRLSFAEM